MLIGGQHPNELGTNQSIPAKKREEAIAVVKSHRLKERAARV